MALKQESKLIQAHIKEVLSGKSSAFEQLYRVHAGRIFTFGLKFFDHNKNAAEELTKRVFIKAFENINSYPEKITFILWLRKFAVEEIRKKDIKMSDEVHQTSPADEAVFSLPEEERTVFILSDIEKLSVEEMVEIMQNSTDEINEKLDSARKHVMEKLKVDSLEKLDSKINLVTQKPEPKEEIWTIIYRQIHSFATKDLKEDSDGEVMNVGDAKLTLSEKFDKLKQKKNKKEIFLKPLGLTITRKAFYTFFLLVLIAVALWYIFFAEQTRWEVVNLAGSPIIKSYKSTTVSTVYTVSNSSFLEGSDFLITDQNSKAVIKIKEVGEIYINPGSSIKRDGNEGDITLNKGLIEIVKPGDSEPLPVEVHSVLIKDYKAGSYSVIVNKNKAKVSSIDASLLLSAKEREVYLIPGYICEIRPKGKIGIPYSPSAAVEFISAVNSFAFEGNKERLNLILLISEKKDALTLLNALPLTDERSRGIVINKLHSLVSMPDKINPLQISNLEKEDLKKWVEEIEKQN